MPSLDDTPRLQAGAAGQNGAVAREPELTIRVWKERHELLLLDGDRVLKTCPVSLGRQSNANKRRRGDGRTPEGTYYISEKRERSRA